MFTLGDTHKEGSLDTAATNTNQRGDQGGPGSDGTGGR
jgi:hypothetical protein